MTERELFEAIGHVDDDLILAADAPVKKRRRVVHLHWQQVVSVAACACIVLGGAAVWRSGTHLGAGREWDLTRKRGGLNIVPPFAERSV